MAIYLSWQTVLVSLVFFVVTLLWSVHGELSALDGAVLLILGERDGIPLRSQRPRASLLSFTWKRFKQFLPPMMLPTVPVTPGGVMLKTMAPTSQAELSFYLLCACCVVCPITCVCVVICKALYVSRFWPY
jgi:hypothetical protein